jgi:hypothetical protein
VTPNQASFNEPYNLMNLNALASIMNAIPIWALQFLLESQINDDNFKLITRNILVWAVAVFLIWLIKKTWL